MGVITSGEVASSRQFGPAMAVEAVLVPEGNNVEAAMAMSTNTNLDETRRRISVNDTDWCQAERSTLGEVREQDYGAKPHERTVRRDRNAHAALADVLTTFSLPPCVTAAPS